MIDNIQIQNAVELINSAKKIAILTHISPDGDAMGSALGLYNTLKENFKLENLNVVTPNDFPKFLAWMPGANDILMYSKCKTLVDTLLDSADLIICTDFNEPKRVGDELGAKLQEVADNTKTPIILIDHHLEPSNFADVIMSYPESASASQLVYEFVEKSGLLFNKQMSLNAAECFYTGMMTDTGNFSFNSNHAEMYEIIGKLVALGVDKDAVYNKVFNTYSADRMRLMGYCMYMKMRVWKKAHVALIAVNRNELQRFNFQSGDAEGLVNLPLQIEDVYYSVFMREDVDKIKISFRSQGDRPVNVFAHDHFNGGGHKNAAGGEFYGSLKDAVDLFEKNFSKYFLLT